MVIIYKLFIQKIYLWVAAWPWLKDLISTQYSCLFQTELSTATTLCPMTNQGKRLPPFGVVRTRYVHLEWTVGCADYLVGRAENVWRKVSYTSLPILLSETLLSESM